MTYKYNIPIDFFLLLFFLLFFLLKGLKDLLVILIIKYFLTLIYMFSSPQDIKDAYIRYEYDILRLKYKLDFEESPTGVIDNLLHRQAVTLGSKKYNQHNFDKINLQRKIDLKKAEASRKRKATIEKNKKAKQAEKQQEYIRISDEKKAYKSFNLFTNTLIKTNKPIKTNDGEIKVVRTTTKRLLRNEVDRVNIQIENYPLTEATSSHIANYINNVRNQVLIDATLKYPQGYNAFFSAVFCDDKNMDKCYSAKFHHTTSLVDIQSKLTKMTDKNYDTFDYILHMRNLMYTIIPLSKQGGCSPKNDKTLTEKNKEGTIKLKSYKSTNNNCLFAIFNELTGRKGNISKPDTIRELLGIKLKTLIPFDQVPKIAEYYQQSYILYNSNYMIIQQKQYNNNFINICLRDDHYYHLIVKGYLKCCGCGKRYNTTYEHKCNINVASYYQTKVQKKRIVKVFKKKEDRLDYNSVMHFDFETFQEDKDGWHQPYAVGWFENEYKVEYGRDCLTKFVDVIKNLENKTISAYNGSGFDFYIIIDMLLELDIIVSNFIITNGKVMAFNFGNGNKIFDLYLFVNSSLDKACDDFKIKNAKGKFDHTKIKTWDDTETYKNEVLPYLKLDVLGLKELFETFNNMIYELKKVNITKYITLSHMAYDIWASNLKDIIEVPTYDKYQFICQSKYGGRCYPQQKTFQSKKYSDIVEKKIQYNNLFNSKDYIFNADVTSLYPAAMKGFDLMPVAYPTGTSTWSKNPKQDFENGLIGIYSIDFIPRKNLRVPILPRRTKTGIKWSLEEGSGVYTSVDIQNAIDAGYEIKFLDKALIWVKSANVFDDYITEFFKLKEDAEREGNKVMRSIAKLMNNALYGKTLQRAIFSKSEIVKTVYEVNRFIADKDKNSIEFTELKSGRVIITGEIKDIEKDKCITKPCQLGCFVTAYSRRIMLLYMKAMDPTLTQQTFTYTDTDSLHIQGKYHQQLIQKGLIKPKDKSQLGYLCSDLDHEALIIREKNLAPKSYMYEYINNKNEIFLGDKGVMKTKGIPKKTLQAKFYEEEQGDVEFSGLKKKGKTLTSADKQMGRHNFCIVNNTLKRTFNKTSWKQMQFIENEWYPHGFEG